MTYDFRFKSFRLHRGFKECLFFEKCKTNVVVYTQRSIIKKNPIISSQKFNLHFTRISDSWWLWVVFLIEHTWIYNLRKIVSKSCADLIFNSWFPYIVGSQENHLKKLCWLNIFLLISRNRWIISYRFIHSL